MYCSNCGVKAGGNFCAACGAKLQVPAERAGVDQTPTELAPSAFEPTGDWADDIVYAHLIEHVEVRDRIARAALRCPNRISGDDILAIYDAIQPTGVPVGKLVKGLVPVLDRMGFNTGQRTEVTLQAAAGQTVVAVLCALSGQGYAVKEVDQLDESCVLTALLPSTFWTHAGELVVGIERRQESMHIQAATKISGQLYDWGQSSRILRDLFDDVRRELGDDGGARRRIA